MKQLLNITNDADFQRLADDGYAPSNLPIFDANGVIMAPAIECDVSVMSGPDRQIIAISMRLETAGLYFGLTADGARAIANCLLASAEELEADALRAAQAAMPTIFKPEDRQHD